MRLCKLIAPSRTRCASLSSPRRGPKLDDRFIAPGRADVADFAGTFITQPCCQTAAVQIFAESSGAAVLTPCREHLGRCTASGQT